MYQELTLCQALPLASHMLPYRSWQSHEAGTIPMLLLGKLEAHN